MLETCLLDAYADARARANRRDRDVRDGLSQRTSPYSLEQTLDPEFLPD